MSEIYLSFEQCHILIAKMNLVYIFSTYKEHRRLKSMFITDMSSYDLQISFRKLKIPIRSM